MHVQDKMQIFFLSYLHRYTNAPSVANPWWNLDNAPDLHTNAPPPTADGADKNQFPSRSKAPGT